MLRLDMPQAAAGSVHTYGAQALPGHRLFFLVSLLAFFFSVVCCSLDVRAAYTAVYDRYSFQSATFLLLVPGLPTTCCCECSRHPWGMCLFLLLAPVELSLKFRRLLVLRLGLNSPSHNIPRCGDLPVATLTPSKIPLKPIEFQQFRFRPHQAHTRSQHNPEVAPKCFKVTLIRQR